MHAELPDHIRAPSIDDHDVAAPLSIHDMTVAYHRKPEIGRAHV